MLPIVLQDLIIDYKMGLNDVLKHKEQIKECCKEINKIKHSYKYNEESECYITCILKKNNKVSTHFMETMYYIHTDRNEDEIETNHLYTSGNIHTCYKYWNFQNDRLVEYYKL